MAGHWPDQDTRVQSADFRPNGTPAPAGPPGVGGPPVQLPAHCEIVGSTRHRTGVDAQNYAIQFHLMLPEEWNGRLFFEGGGGLNGNLGAALGMLGFGKPPALAAGYAVLSQDAGHDNEVNSDPAQGGQAAFGFDPRARADGGRPPCGDGGGADAVAGNVRSKGASVALLKRRPVIRVVTVFRSSKSQPDVIAIPLLRLTTSNSSKRFQSFGLRTLSWAVTIGPLSCLS